MVASVARQLRWACFHDRIEFAAAELMRLEGDFCRFAGEGQEVWRQGAERRLNNTNPAKRGTLLKTQNQFFKPKHELNGIFEASVLSRSGIPPIPHYAHSLHGTNGSGFGGLEN